MSPVWGGGYTSHCLEIGLFDAGYSGGYSKWIFTFRTGYSK